jgi:hypothetical protein
MTNTLISKSDVAAILGVKILAVNRLVKSGALRHVRISPRIIKFSPDDVNEFIENRSTEIYEANHSKLEGRK